MTELPPLSARLSCPQGINVNCGLLLLSTLSVALPSLLSETQTQVSGLG